VHELWFITPAFRRFELTALCLDQRRRLCDELARAGVQANCVVVADDENLELARERGFEAVERRNNFLGMKFSAGYTHAMQQGATHMMPIGSDSWMTPGLVLSLPFAADALGGTTRLSSLRADGRERLDLEIDYGIGFGVASLYPRAAMDGVQHPCAPNISRGCDTSTYNRTARQKEMAVEMVFYHAMEYTDFKSYDVQTTNWTKLRDRHYAKATRVATGDDAIEELRELYEDDLVDRLRDMYAERPPWTG
jgi:hypothetical protein